MHDMKMGCNRYPDGTADDPCRWEAYGEQVVETLICPNRSHAATARELRIP